MRIVKLYNSKFIRVRVDVNITSGVGKIKYPVVSFDFDDCSDRKSYF